MQSRFIQLTVALIVMGALCSTGNAAAQVLFEGRLTDRSGSGIAGADLDFFDAESGTKTDPFPADRQNQSDNTDGFGYFSMIVKPAIYHVRFEPPAGRRDLAPTLERDVVLAGPITLDVTLPNGVRVTGLVRGPDGSPLQGVDIDLFNRATRRKATTVSDDSQADGRFDFSVIPGVYDVEFNPPIELEVAPQIVASVDITDHTEVNADLPFGFLITGTVLDGAGRGIFLADIDVVDAITNSRFPTPDDNTIWGGAFGIRLPRGRYHVLATAPSELGWAPGALYDLQVDGDQSLLEINLADGIPVAGIVLSPDGTPLSSADIDLFISGTKLPVPADPIGVTDAEGRFLIQVEQGIYDIQVQPSPDQGGESILFDSLTIADTSELVLRFPAVPDTRVFVSSLVSDSGGVAIEGVRVTGTSLESDAVWEVVSDASGAIRFLVEPGEYSITVVPPEGAGLREIHWPTLNIPDDFPTTLVLEKAEVPETPTAFFMRVAPNPFSIDATIRLSIPHSRPAADLHVYDYAGRLVATLRSGPIAAGETSVVWSGRNNSGERVSPGVYFAVLETEHERASLKVINIR